MYFSVCLYFTLTTELPLLQVLPDGSYSIGPRQLSESDATARFEHCLAGADPERRVRVVTTLKRLGADGAWKLLNTEVRGPHHKSASGSVSACYA